jgi:hypothetical protein
MRALAAVLVAAFVIVLSGAAPVSAQESSTPGIWINPKLGLGGPMAPIGNDRTRAFANRETCDRIPGRDGILIPSHEYASCLALAHVMELRPYEGELETKATFLPTQDTIARLSPVHFWVTNNEFYRAIDSESFGSPDHYLKENGPHFIRERFVEGRPWRRGKHLARWAVWAEGPEETVAGLRFVPKIRLESFYEFYSFEVWGVGRWPESGDLVLVVLSRLSYIIHRRGMWGPSYHLMLLCHDPRLDMFRFINFVDYDGFRNQNGTCHAAQNP